MMGGTRDAGRQQEHLSTHNNQHESNGRDPEHLQGKLLRTPVLIRKYLLPTVDTSTPVLQTSTLSCTPQ
jgi:hypothetical protein